jgi:cytochrome P450
MFVACDDLRGPVADLVKLMRQCTDAIDLQPLFSRLTLDMTTAYLLGQSVGSLTAPAGSPTQRFAAAFDIAQAQAANGLRVFNLRWFSNRQEQQSCQYIRDSVDRLLDCSTSAVTEERQSIKSRGIVHDLKQELPDRAALRGQIIHLLAAGRDTTASLLSWTL